MAIRVMLVDDHGIMREGLRSLLQKQPDMHIVAEASTGREALQKAQATSPQIVVMDITMPDMNGIEATRQLRNTHAHLQVLALSMKTDRRTVAGILSAGAAGFVEKECLCEELVRAVRTIYRGNPYLSPSIQGILMGTFMQSMEGCCFEELSRSPLTAREREILQLIAEGVTTKEIAGTLGLSPKTIETHRANIMAKTGARNVAALTKYAIQEGLTALEL